MKKTDQTVLLLEKNIFSSHKSRLLESLRKKVIGTKKPLIIFTPNPEQLVLAAKDRQFRSDFDQADYLLPDGIGLVLASRVLSLFGKAEPISQRISGIELSTDFLEWATDEQWPVLLLGGRDYHQAKNQPVKLAMSAHRRRGDASAAKKLQLQWLEGYANVAKPTKREEQLVRQTLRQLKPKIVLVAFGAPWQERWVIEHRALLRQTGVKVAMVVGGSFDVLLGRLQRAPLWMRALGLEWFYRLIQEPHRWRRQLALLEFMKMVFQEVFRKNAIPKKI